MNGEADLRKRRRRKRPEGTEKKELGSRRVSLEEAGSSLVECIMETHVVDDDDASDPNCKGESFSGRRRREAAANCECEKWKLSSEYTF